MVSSNKRQNLYTGKDNLSWLPCVASRCVWVYLGLEEFTGVSLAVSMFGENIGVTILATIVWPRL